MMAAGTDLQSYINSIVSGGFVPPDLVAATNSGLGRTDLNALLTQAGLNLGVGTIDPYVLEQELMNYLGQLDSERVAEIERLNRERQSQILSIEAKYTVVPPAQLNYDTVDYTPFMGANGALTSQAATFLVLWRMVQMFIARLMRLVMGLMMR